MEEVAYGAALGVLTSASAHRGLTSASASALFCGGKWRASAGPVPRALAALDATIVRLGRLPEGSLELLVDPFVAVPRRRRGGAQSSASSRDGAGAVRRNRRVFGWLAREHGETLVSSLCNALDMHGNDDGGSRNSDERYRGRCLALGAAVVAQDLAVACIAEGPRVSEPVNNGESLGGTEETAQRRRPLVEEAAPRPASNTLRRVALGQLSQLAGVVPALVSCAQRCAELRKADGASTDDELPTRLERTAVDSAILISGLLAEQADLRQTLWGLLDPLVRACSMISGWERALCEVRKRETGPASLFAALNLQSRLIDAVYSDVRNLLSRLADLAPKDGGAADETTVALQGVLAWHWSAYASLVCGRVWSSVAIAKVSASDRLPGLLGVPHGLTGATDLDRTAALCARMSQWVGALVDRSDEDAEADDDPSVSEAQTEIRMLALRCLSLDLGRLSPRRLTLVLRQLGASAMEAASRLLSASQEAAQSMSALLLRMILAATLSEGGDSSSTAETLPALFALLQNHDGVSKAVAGLIAEVVVAHPDQGVPPLFAFLDEKSEVESAEGSALDAKLARRKNALAVIAEVFEQADQLAGSAEPGRSDSSAGEFSASKAASMASSRVLDKRLCEELLARLHDEDIGLRVKAARLFGRVQPAFVAPRLCRMMGSRDDRVRSAAGSAIVTLMSDAIDTVDAALVLLDCIRHGPSGESEMPQSPAEIGVAREAPVELPQESSRWQDRVLNLIPRWASNLSDDAWMRLAPAVVDKVFSAPQDRVLVKFLSSVVSSAGPHRPYHEMIARVAHRMETQAVLTATLLEEGAVDDLSAAAVRDLLFERLSPLLVLRTLPLAAFQYSTDNSEDLAQVYQLLLQRMVQVHEYDEVRRVAAEIFARGELETTISFVVMALDGFLGKLKPSSESGPASSGARWTPKADDLEAIGCGDPRVVRVFVYALCHAATLHSGDVAGVAACVSSRLFDVLRAPLSEPASPSEEPSSLYKLQRGCIDALAAIVCSLPYADGRPALETGESQADGAASGGPTAASGGHAPLIVELRDSELPTSAPPEASGTSRASASVISLADTDGAMDPSFEAAVLYLVSVLGQHSSDEDTAGEHPKALRVCCANVLISMSNVLRGSPRLVRLAEVAVPRSLRLASPQSRLGDPDALAAVLQVLFTVTMVSAAVVGCTARELHECANFALQHGEAAVRIAGLKLWGAITTVCPDMATAVPLTDFMNVHRRLEGMARMDPSRDVRKLADQLRRAVAHK